MAFLLAIAGEAIIALIFFSLIPVQVLPTDLRVLDFIVTTIAYFLIIGNILTPIINKNDPSHKEVGGLGVRWAAVTVYLISAMLVVVGNLIYSWTTFEPALSFGFQAVIQGILLIILLWWLLGSKESIEQTKEVYERERKLKEAKADVKRALTDTLNSVEDTPGIPDDVRERLRRLSGEIRYLSPSTSPEASAADRKIITDCDAIAASFSDYKMNEEAIGRRLDQLERDIERRRKMY